MTNKIYQIDAFSSEPFKGNPAGVMILDQEPSVDWMQNMAMEMNLAETTYLVPSDDGYKIRYFTPTKEVAICGHATLASAHLVYELGLKQMDETIAFHAGGGDFLVTQNDGWINMDFPRFDLDKVEVPLPVNEAVGFEPVDVFESDYQWIIAIAENEEDVVNAVPDLRFMSENGLGHLMITAESKDLEIDFVVRCFAPISGIDEDPVTGSAHCALTPLWSERLSKLELTSKQVSHRTGILKVKMLGDRVGISGQAVTVFEAELK